MKLDYGKQMAFWEYVKARKVQAYNESINRKHFAERLRLKAEWLAKEFPDFPAAFNRMESSR